MDLKSKIHTTFLKTFSKSGNLFCSGGRINLIGEHTDYNEGYVFPGAIDKVIMAEIRPNDTDIVNLVSLDMNERVSFGLEESDLPDEQWARYIFGICREIIKRGGKVRGFDAVFAGNVPLGAGLSSSAALESCFAFALNRLFNNDSFSRIQLALAGQSTEHNYCGVKCGIMDQFASMMGKQNQLIRIDCRSMDYEYYPFESEDYELLLVDSKVKHELTGSPYNDRRESCERVASTIGVPSLREANMEMLENIKHKISDEDYRRAKYVIEEIGRVLTVCDALKRRDFNLVGEMMYLTHHGLSKDYDVSCEELDFLNDLAKQSGVTGSRMMGGGFGGCTINLIKKEITQSFIETVKREFNAKYGISPDFYPVTISDGARQLQ